MCYQCPWVPNFTPFRSTTSSFRDTGHFETSALNDPKLTLNPARWNYPIYVYLVSLIPKFHPASLFGQPFSRYSHFETSAPNDLKMNLNTTRPCVPHIYVTSIHESQSLLQSDLRQAILEIQAILRQLHRMTSNWNPNWTLTLNPTRSNYPIYV